MEYRNIERNLINIKVLQLSFLLTSDRLSFLARDCNFFSWFSFCAIFVLNGTLLGCEVPNFLEIR